MALSAQAATNINSPNSYSWGANIGWMNWRGDDANGAVIGEYGLSGYIYGANVGWINLGDGDPVNHLQYQNNSAADFGVNFIRNGNEASLRGYAWGANIGWINFEATGNPRVDLTTRQLHGYAYSANVGWINLGEMGVSLQANSIAPGADTDGNGLADGFETTYFGQLGVNPNGDPDGDGATNLQEELAGTNPVFSDVRLLNIATRLRVLQGDNVLIGGFIITGTQPKRIAVRGIGPSLAALGVPGTLSDPTLELHAADNSLITSNDNWQEAPNAAEVSAVGLAPGDSRESVILQTLAPGSYSAILRGKNEEPGNGIVEAYDLDQSVASKFGNIASRGFVDTDDNVMIGGVIVNGTGTGSPTIVVRAIGPSLAPFGIQNTLADPTLELHDGNGAVIAFNDNWKDSQQAEIEASGLMPTDEKESAIVRALAPGNYSAIVRGAGNTTGVGVVEAYNISH